MSSIRDKQNAALQSMLNLNTPVNVKSKSEPVWKLLIYDRAGQDIISPLLTVKNLRDAGVTLHMNLHSNRDAVPDVPAIYFVLPTEENIMRICQDFRNNLYDAYYLNFISPVSRQKLEDLATTAVQLNITNCVTKIYDQYLNFICLENDLFVLKQQEREAISYYALNKGQMKDTEMEAVLDSIVDGLFSVFVTLGVVPIIRSPKRNAAEMVAEKLNKRLKDNLQDVRNSLFNGGDVFEQGIQPLSFHRPLLLIVDRNIDMASPLHHTWTYQALVHDVLDLKLNQVKVVEPRDDNVEQAARAKKPATKSYDLNPSDKFWEKHKGSPFPQVAEAVQEELELYRSSEEEVKRLKSMMGLDSSVNDEAIAVLSDNTAKLTSAVGSLPELLEKKRLIDMHMTVATAVLDHIKSRKLDNYFEIEEKILSKSAVDSKSTLELINNTAAGTTVDKLRLALIHFICSPNHFTESEFKEYEAALSDAGCSIDALHYIRRWKSFSKFAASNGLYDGQYGGGTKTFSMFTKLMSQGSQLVMEGVKNLKVNKHNLPLTRVVDAIMEMKSHPDADDYRYFDPKIFKSSDGMLQKNRSVFQDAIVFVVGGGNYIEYQNLMDYCTNKSKTSPKRIVYGSTDLMNSTLFLQQLEKLGEEMTNS